MLFLTACGNKQEQRDSAAEKYEEGSAAVREVELSCIRKMSGRVL